MFIYHNLKKGLAQTIHTLCSVINNVRSFKPFMCLDLVFKCQQSSLLQVFFKGFSGLIIFYLFAQN